MNQLELTRLAILLQAQLGHSAGGINLEEVPRLLEAAPLEAIKSAEAAWEAAKAARQAGEVWSWPGGCRYAPGTQEAEEAARETYVALVRVWASACPDECPGICTPQMKYSTPTGAVNWDLESQAPRVWIERSKPGQAGQGLPGDKVVTYIIESKTWFWTARAEARHFKTMAGIIGAIDPEASRMMAIKADEATILERRSAFRQAIIGVKPMTPGWESLVDCLEEGLALLKPGLPGEILPSPSDCQRTGQVRLWKSYLSDPKQFEYYDFIQALKDAGTVFKPVPVPVPVPSLDNW